MKIHALTACVDYWDLLSVGAPRWMEGLDSWTIVTSGKNEEDATSWLEFYGTSKVEIIGTDIWYADGAAFNKGRAMEYALQRYVPWKDWILFIDADIVPEKDWFRKLRDFPCDPLRLHGAKRREALTSADIDRPYAPIINDDRIGYGYFQLFHSTAPTVQRQPLLDIHWTHAGNYDSSFLLSWPMRPIEVPIDLWHLGDAASHNWFGRGRAAEFTRMENERIQRGGGWASLEGEKIQLT